MSEHVKTAKELANEPLTPEEQTDLVLQPYYINAREKMQRIADSMQTISAYEPPEELIQRYMKQQSWPRKFAARFAERRWKAIYTCAPFHRELSTWIEPLEKLTKGSNRNIADRAVWALAVVRLARETIGTRSLIMLMDMLRRAFGHDSTNVKVKHNLPSLEDLRKWRDEALSSRADREILPGIPEIPTREKMLDAEFSVKEPQSADQPGNG